MALTVKPTKPLRDENDYFGYRYHQEDDDTEEEYEDEHEDGDEEEEEEEEDETIGDDDWKLSDKINESERIYEQLSPPFIVEFHEILMEDLMSDIVNEMQYDID